MPFFVVYAGSFVLSYSYKINLFDRCRFFESFYNFYFLFSLVNFKIESTKRLLISFKIKIKVWFLVNLLCLFIINKFLYQLCSNKYPGECDFDSVYTCINRNREKATQTPNEHFCQILIEAKVLCLCIKRKEKR